MVFNFTVQSLTSRASVEDEEAESHKDRARAHAANQAKEGELKKEYEKFLEQQRKLKEEEAEENERKLREFLAADPELSRNAPAAGAGESDAESSAAVVALLKQEEEELRRRKEQEEKDAQFARQLAEQLSHQQSRVKKVSAPFEMTTRKRNYAQASAPRSQSQAEPSARNGSQRKRSRSKLRAQTGVSLPARRSSPALPGSASAVIDLCSPARSQSNSNSPSQRSPSQHSPYEQRRSPFIARRTPEQQTSTSFRHRSQLKYRAVPGNTLHRFLHSSQSQSPPKSQ